MNKITTAITMTLALTLGACSLQRPADNGRDAPVSPRIAGDELAVATDVDACRAQLASDTAPGGSSLAGYQLSLVSWNMKKASLPYWEVDFVRLAADRDLVLLQEAVWREDLIGQLSGHEHWSFAPGYQSRFDQTGVLTLSRSAPLSRCNLTHREPWLGTPKVTTVTQYPLDGVAGTLVVVNLHAINFTVGTGAFARQLGDVLSLLSGHAGPVILSGDFNTWRPRRMQILEAVTTSLRLEPLSFEADHRKKVFGQRLDHIYVRGFSGYSASTETVLTSDHNPLAAELVL